MIGVYLKKVLNQKDQSLYILHPDYHLMLNLFLLPKKNAKSFSKSS